MIYIFDGAMGTMLQQAGLPAGACPESWCINRPEAITSVHAQYVNAGAQIIETNTFGANRIKLTHYGLSDRVYEICHAAVRAAKAACGPNTQIAGSVGPTGKLIAPLGDLPFEEAYEAFREQISALDEAGADLIIIETIIDIQEMRAALLAAKASTKKPVICQLTFEKDGRTVTGTDPETAAITLDSLGADIIGANCSLGPEQLVSVIKTMSRVTAKPLSVQPNAGMPMLENGQTVFPMSPAEFAEWCTKLAAAGANYIGGCCGTTPDHIRAARQAIQPLPAPVHANIDPQVALTSRSKTVYIGKYFPTVIIGERINPTGRKALAAELKDGVFHIVKKEALAQVEAGAAVLDVNMGVPGVDQTNLMRQAVEQLAMLTDAPLSIDTTDYAALEAGLRRYPGRALINSVSGEPERLESFLPLAKKYGAAILCLPLEAGGVPVHASERVVIIKRIVAAAKAAGLSEKDFLLDALTLTVAADGQAARETLNTLTAYRREFGFPAVMGLSNVSFGLPRRDLLNAAFCAMALTAGLDAPILNPYDPLMKDILRASAVLLGHDQHAKIYSKAYANSQTPASVTPKPLPEAAQLTPEADITILERIRKCVIAGDKDSAHQLVKQALREGHGPLSITNQSLTGAMNVIGEDFGKGRIFLPQVLLSAETMRVAFQTIKETLPAHQTASYGKVLLATVQGDIHDLGKNIVAALLENNGFTVVDLGKDVPAEDICQTAHSEQADVIGLCALMTTTLPQIDRTIRQLKAAGSTAKIIVGGAVLTEEYAKKAGADRYVQDGVKAVNICKELLAVR